MSFDNNHVYRTTAEQHRDELIRQAAEYRMVRRAKQERRALWQRLSEPRGGPDAA
jgi:DNA polymerase III psi subunit